LSIASETKTVTYKKVLTNLSGFNKCCITQNIRASSLASSATDNTEASTGWYWQFNRKQGYKSYQGRTPITWPYISENSDWITANDPCTILHVGGWRIPTKTEWESADYYEEVGIIIPILML